MGAFLTILAVLCLVCLILAAAMQPLRSSYSVAELQRRAKRSEAYVLDLRRAELHPSIVTLLHTVRALLLVLLTCLSIGIFNWFWGIVGALLVACLYPAIARIPGVRRAAGSLYKVLEGGVLDFVSKFEHIITAFREPATTVRESPHQLHSKEELAEIIERSKDVVGEKERRLLASVLDFPERTVETIMTPRSVIDFIKKSEFLGPLVLDELHTLGHSRLPVIDEDLDHVAGILHVRDMLSLDVRESKTAEQMMEKKVYYIRHDDTLEHALSAFIKTRHHLFIVINENRETVGLITLEDVVEALIGRKIIDEDDVHADLRAVAAQKAVHNNHAEGHGDL